MKGQDKMVQGWFRVETTNIIYKLPAATSMPGTSSVSVTEPPVTCPVCCMAKLFYSTQYARKTKGACLFKAASESYSLALKPNIQVWREDYFLRAPDLPV